MEKREAERRITQILHELERASGKAPDEVILWKDRTEPRRLTVQKVEVRMIQREFVDRPFKHQFEQDIRSNAAKLQRNRNLALHVFCALCGNSFIKTAVMPGTQLDLLDNVYAPREEDAVKLIVAHSNLKESVLTGHPRVAERKGSISHEAAVFLHELGWEHNE